MNRADLSDMSKVTPQALDELGNELGRKLRPIKTHQIRNLYSQVQRIRTQAERRPDDLTGINRQFIFLKPRLAYASGRQERNNQEIMKELRDRLVEAIDGVVKRTEQKEHEKARENFFFLMEAIVAYHKFHGGKDS